MASQKDYLTTLVKRLEAATSRLEDLIPSVDSEPPNGADSSQAPRSVSGTAGQVPTSAAQSTPKQEPFPPAIEDFNTFMNTELKDFRDRSEKIGSSVVEQASYSHNQNPA